MSKTKLSFDAPIYVLAPLAGYTDLPFRSVVKKFGADLTVSEMLSSNALVHGSSKTLSMIEKSPNEDPYSVQLAGAEVDVIKRAVEILNEQEGIDVIDLNCGCPVPKIVGHGSGSSLLLNLPLMGDIIKTIKDTSNKSLTSVKIRLGFEKKNHIEIAKIVEGSGADFLAVHGRTRAGKFKSEVDYDAIREIKESVKIITDLVRNLKAIKIELSFVDVGGGLGIVYKDETLIDTNEYAQSILENMFGLDITIICEPGRFMVGNAGTFVTKVLYEKVNGNKRFVIVDGAMNDLIRPSLYNAYHRIEVLNDNQEFSDCNLVGPVCESGDFFAKNVQLPKTEHNDLVAIYSAGAYGFTMASNYNTRGKVAEIAIENGNDRLIRRRETFEDIIALEEEFIK